jgi:hypothetical protein
MKYLQILFFLTASFPVFAWNGYDYDKGSYVEIDKNNLVRTGKDIEIYDYDAGEYKDVEVQSIHDSGSSTEVEVYDPSSNEYRTLDMDKE